LFALIRCSIFLVPVTHFYEQKILESMYATRDP